MLVFNSKLFSTKDWTLLFNWMVILFFRADLWQNHYSITYRKKWRHKIAFLYSSPIHIGLCEKNVSKNFEVMKRTCSGSDVSRVCSWVFIINDPKAWELPAFPSIISVTCFVASILLAIAAPLLAWVVQWFLRLIVWIFLGPLMALVDKFYVELDGEDDGSTAFLRTIYLLLSLLLQNEHCSQFV